MKEGKRVERAANNGRQPKHPINLTGPDLKPRGVLNFLTPERRRRGRNPYITLHSPEKGAMPCAIAAWKGGRVAKEGEG